MNSKFRAILKRIKEYDEIVIARHIGPDPDAIASQIALRDAIRLRFPSKKVYAVGNPVAKYKYYGSLDKVDESKLKDPLLFVLDCPNISRIDCVNFDTYTEVIKIDHHPNVEAYGDYQYDIEVKSEDLVKTIGQGTITLTEEITHRRDE